MGHVLNAAFVIGVIAYLYALRQKLERQADALERVRQDAADTAMLLSRPEWVVTNRDFYNQWESEHSRDDVFDTVPGICPPGHEKEEASFFTSRLVLDILHREKSWARIGTTVEFSVRPSIDSPGNPENMVRCRRSQREPALAS